MSRITSGAGLDALWIHDVDEDGYVYTDIEGVAGSGGIRLEGAKSYGYQPPAPRQVDHTGDNELIASDLIAPASTGTGNMTTAKQNKAADVSAEGTKVNTVGEVQYWGMGTDKAGNPPDKCVVVYRRAIDTADDSATFGKRRWQIRIHPVCRVTVQGSNVQEAGADENAYTLTPTPAGQYPWGVAFTEATNGFTRAAVVPGDAEYPPMLHAWKGNGTIGAAGSPLQVDYAPISVAKTDVWVNGTPATVSAVDVDNKTITLDAAPADDSRIVAQYETGDQL